MKKYHNIEKLEFIDNDLIILIDNNTYRFSLKKYSTLLYNANAIERNTYEISESGYGIHWELIDEDLSIDGLLGIIHKPNFLERAV